MGVPPAVTLPTSHSQSKRQRSASVCNAQPYRLLLVPQVLLALLPFREPQFRGVAVAAWDSV